LASGTLGYRSIGQAIVGLVDGALLKVATASGPPEGRSDMMVLTARLSAVATAVNALGSAARSEAYCATFSTAARTAAERDPNPAEFSWSAVIKPVAQAAPAKYRADVYGASPLKTKVRTGVEAASRRSSS
jgi:hypothetical protein